MLFRNLHIFRFSQELDLDEGLLQEKLAAHAFRPCSSHEQSQYGWVPPLGGGAEQYAHFANGYIMICAQRQDRLLPASVIREQLEEQLSSIREKEQRAVGRKERQQLKDEIIFDLLPRAFTRSVRQYAYISPRDGWIVIDSASASRSEALLNCLRESLGRLPVTPLSCKAAVPERMTSWLRDSTAPQGFTFGGDCVLVDRHNEGARISAKKLDLHSEELQAYVHQGMMASQMALNWQDRIESVIDERLLIRRLRFSDVLMESLNDREPEDAAEKFDQDFAMMTLELAAFIKAVIKAFGGEDSAEFDNGSAAVYQPKRDTVDLQEQRRATPEPA